ncbi:MAG: ABC-F family ATP-binding cassette domain-containing protein [Peptoniphilaceae bacterium]|nr:ABC-F family ATP-binding cassette domain-containing protein [Peptoniphilaceae bacterium]MDY6085724.1 ABC-F family ATP-binding cassette domain-containing protein [Peptoniphilaceae bacterium]
MTEMSVAQLHKSYGVRPILEDVSFLIQEGDKIGVIGPNGAGKTTLMRMLVGELTPDGGEIHHRDDLRIGYLKQNVRIESDESVYVFCRHAYDRAFRIEKELKELEAQMGELADAPKELERVMERHRLLTERFVDEGGLSYDSEIRGVLKGMGFTEEDFEKPVSVLSGGEKSRLELASMLCGRPDILFLDEPTNHLDMDVLSFLETMLVNFRGALMVISHDRYFLDRVCTRIFLVEHEHLTAYNCSYQEYTQRRAKDLEVMRHAYENQQQEIARQEEIIDRLSRLGGSKRKRGIAQSRSRQKLLDKMVRLDKPPEEVAHMKFRLAPAYPSGEDVLSVKDLAKSFDGQRLFQDVSFELHKGQRVGLVGENGAGKTTLFRMLLKQQEADAGAIAFGASVKVAFFDQEQRQLSLDKTVLDELWDRYPQMDHFTVRGHLARFQFVGDDIFRLVGDLSGGEKARLSLLKLMLSSANVLLLDEPTNHLDIESREILEDALIDYEGTVFVISHDRYFLNHVATDIYHLTPSGMETVSGNYDAFLAFEEAQKSGGESVDSAEKTRTQIKKDKKEAQRAKRELRQLRARSGEITRLLDDLTAQEEELTRKSYDPALYENYEDALRIQDELLQIQKKKEALTDEWFLLEEQLEEEA